MADLGIKEKRRFERVLDMGKGYVLDFSDRTFREFVADSTGRDIYDERYNYASGSKANRLRGFWTEETNRTVAKLLSDLLDHGLKILSIKPDDAELEDCRRSVRRLSQDSAVSEIDALSAISDEKDFEAIAHFFSQQKGLCDTQHIRTEGKCAKK